jgi:hypothetical protein
MGSSAAFAQSTLPAIGPTGPPPPATNAVDVAIAPPPPEHRAIVSYQQGQLSVIADNSSLNQILGDISRQTGMKIIGGVADQPVYGTYGPGAPAQILVALLEGTHRRQYSDRARSHPARRQSHASQSHRTTRR